MPKDDKRPMDHKDGTQKNNDDRRKIDAPDSTTKKSKKGKN